MSVRDRAIRLGDERPEEGDALRYALLIYDDMEVRDRTPADDRRRITAAVLEVLERPEVTGWLRLQDVESATTVRREQGRSLLTDGPFIESKEVLGGYWIVEASSKEELVKWAQRCPADEGDVIEIRQIFDEADFAIKK